MKVVLKRLAIFFIAVVMIATTLLPAQANASAAVHEAQRIMTKFGIPTGPIDGIDGAETQRGLCIFRFISKLPVSRKPLDSTTLKKLRAYNDKYTSLGKIPAPFTSVYKEYLYAHETCQAMTYSVQKSGSTTHYLRRVMAITTGISSKPTPNGYYSVSPTSKGWLCSGLYPESCTNNYGVGRFGTLKTQSNYPAGYGNMYNFRTFKAGGWGIHGSRYIKTYPASAGCIRVSITDSDWMYDHVGNSGNMRLKVTGAY